ncbi:hypothetical protein NEUTE1DRAFT_109762 [Neurospora tetrasperma FGSC 2508]|uniref:Uncharacterized protein n=1 Tax=Neurospora tetrasperma (strain FGSC 2508 / ATCC MYA-4615 / P0657) TaxID=510951 RepID=F8ML54_NEUT8|nr:uncharacterized protein NEUTE1DRAFT_109762 [Neurospora tetrasperma FGSC 2508]EGO57529.1 hypothetical protein NEUTE1DRAFT_109762 [Neurospora tetrasperma FGSC 2508]EGZ72212.1 hypothetical protein NEUTE2DRAFT_64488 [Neurospora tetrasperma FGSC 2509]
MLSQSAQPYQSLMGSQFRRAYVLEMLREKVGAFEVLHGGKHAHIASRRRRRRRHGRQRVSLLHVVADGLAFTLSNEVVLLRHDGRSPQVLVDHQPDFNREADEGRMLRLSFYWKSEREKGERSLVGERGPRDPTTRKDSKAFITCSAVPTGVSSSSVWLAETCGISAV